MIKLENIQRNFQVGEQVVHALDNISLSIQDGEYVSIMGPSGSGKSTLLNLLGLLDQPSSGTYYLNNINVTNLTENQQAITRNKSIGFVFQTFHLVPRLTAAENIELPLVLAGIAESDRKKRVHQSLQEMNLLDRSDHKPQQLSGGQRQRVAIARATITKPSILLADEPTGNLDQKSGLNVVHILEQLNEQGITLIVVTHDEKLGARSKRSIRMLDGGIEYDKMEDPHAVDA